MGFQNCVSDLQWPCVRASAISEVRRSARWVDDQFTWHFSRDNNVLRLRRRCPTSFADTNISFSTPSIAGQGFPVSVISVPHILPFSIKSTALSMSRAKAVIFSGSTPVANRSSKINLPICP